MPSYAATISVNSHLDDGSFCTLRDAITSINNGTVFTAGCVDSTSDGLGLDDKIIFDLPNSQRQILLENGELQINKSIIISGSETSAVTVRAATTSGNRFRLFNIDSGSQVTLERLNMQYGLINNDHGGCIKVSNGASLALVFSTVENCNTNNLGGGVHVDQGTLVVKNSLIRNNQANGGGGVSAGDGSNLEIRNSTISGNESPNANVGGGIYVNDSSAAFYNITIANNTTYEDSAFGDECCGIGGGLFASGSSMVNILNSIIADSDARASDCNISGQATITSDSSSIIESGNCTQANTLARKVDPGLFPLRSIENALAAHSLAANARARDSGDNASCEGIDQNGSIRSLNNPDPCDVGAIEAKFNPNDDSFFVIPMKEGGRVIFNL